MPRYGLGLAEGQEEGAFHAEAAGPRVHPGSTPRAWQLRVLLVWVPLGLEPLGGQVRKGTALVLVEPSLQLREQRLRTQCPGAGRGFQASTLTRSP